VREAQRSLALALGADEVLVLGEALSNQSAWNHVVDTVGGAAVTSLVETFGRAVKSKHWRPRPFRPTVYQAFRSSLQCMLTPGSSRVLRAPLPTAKFPSQLLSVSRLLTRGRRIA
jgi:hypothetical protein